MRVLFVHNAYQQAGGEDVVVRAEMALLRERGHEVRLYGRSNDELHGRSALGAGMEAVWSRRAAAEIDTLCADFDPEVIHVHNTFLVISPSVYWAAARRRIPVVQTLHNFRLLCPQGTFLREGAICEDCVNRKPWRAVSRKCYRGSALQSAVLAGVITAHAGIGTYHRKVTRYIALSEFSRSRFIAGGLDADKFRVKPNFVDCAAVPHWEGRRGGLFVGRLSREKGIGTLMDAIRLLGRNVVSVAGGGAYAAEVAQQIGERYLGFLAPEALAAQLRAAQFLILPSIGHEQMPMTALEAFAHGVPVIASRLGALADIVEDGVTGLLTEPGDAKDLADKIGWAVTHQERVEEMGRAAYAEYQKKYTASINYNILVDIYEDAIAAARGRERPVAQGASGAWHLD